MQRPVSRFSLPWTLLDLLEALAERSQGTALVDPFPDHLSKPLIAAIRELSASDCTLDDLRRVGEMWAARVGANWHDSGVAMSQCARRGFLVEEVARARKWVKDGKPSRRPGSQQAGAPKRWVDVAPVPDLDDFTPTGPDPLAEMLN